MNERDREKKLRAWFDEAHRGHQPPAFGRTWEAARRMRPKRVALWALIPALAAAVLLLVLGVRRQLRPPATAQEFQTAPWIREADARLGVAVPFTGIVDSLGASGGLQAAALGPSVLGRLAATGPLDFLLQTPGSELLHDVPTFDTDRSWP